MEKNKYNWLTRLINKITRKEESNNQSFVYYGHLVHVQSGTVDFMDVTVCNTADGGDVLASFSFDFWTKELEINQCKHDEIRDVIEDAFCKIYRGVKSNHISMTNLNKILTHGEAEITDASNCQICVHLGKDRFIYLEPKCMIPATQHPNAATIIQRAKKGLQTKADFDLFRIEEIDYNDLDDEIKKEIIDAYGIGKPENYTQDYYRQLIVEGVFELEYV